MSENTRSIINAQARERDFRVKMIYHPVLHVVDLDEAEDFYRRVFGRSSTPLASVRKAPPKPNHSIDHSIFTSVGDVLIDSLDPKRYITGGVQRPAVEQGHLQTFGWYIEGMPELYRELKHQGIRVTNSQDEIAEGDELPMAGPIPHFHTLPVDAGIRYYFFPLFPFKPDLRLTPDWSIPVVSEDDPLGIEYCSHHTVLTDNPNRAHKFVVDVLGGTVIHEGHDNVRCVTGSYVHLADAILQYAAPDADSAAQADLAANGADDVYHAITWKVVDIDRVERHVEAQGLRILTRTDDTIITDPSTSLGVPWGFTTKRVPGDPR
ncbi:MULTISPECIES: VOC family protein [Rhodococcus]|uniref:VOC domain-containing protein n=1 Tax=Nocardia globerula TaxID=1818 RepID=A0A652YHG7_NOCGL|nr:MULTISPECIES: hypothetical protein [Rhodococcus]PVX63355.1 hypothetical protein C8E04_0614 [Rhodococcus globerulus]QXV99836.1 VOC family protein [Rhodococcus globerulus]